MESPDPKTDFGHEQPVGVVAEMSDKWSFRIKPRVQRPIIVPHVCVTEQTELVCADTLRIACAINRWCVSRRH